MRVLVTGHRGYIGSVMVGVMRRLGFDVVGLDCDLYRGCDFGRVHQPIPALEIDLRDIGSAALRSFDAVVHLAALADEVSGAVGPKLLGEINLEATIRLAECCKQANVRRLLFASSCSVYGPGRPGLLDEQSPPDPLTQAAESKLRCEQNLARLADGGFSPVYLRNATVYGVSPRFRLDLIVNDLVSSAAVRGRIDLDAAGQAWRPLIHVEDLARSYVAALTAPDEVVQNEVINVVPPKHNYRVSDIAEAAVELFPDTTWSAAHRRFDNRSCRVDGSKLRRAFPRLTFHWTLRRGIRQIHRAVLSAGLTPGEWRADRYRRALRLHTLVERGELDTHLRRVPAVLA